MKTYELEIDIQSRLKIRAGSLDEAHKEALSGLGVHFAGDAHLTKEGFALVGVLKDGIRMERPFLEDEA